MNKRVQILKKKKPYENYRYSKSKTCKMPYTAQKSLLAEPEFETLLLSKEPTHISKSFTNGNI